MWDLFISHASEDKNSIARPLYKRLRKHGYSVWFDEATLKLGDSLPRKIDEGLASCRFGVVIISKAFLSKEWPQRELDALVSREDGGDKVVLPVWHKITKEEVASKSPLLSSKLAVSTEEGQNKVIEAIISAIGEPKPIPALSAPGGSSNSPKTLEDLYVEACEREELFVEFCRDVINHGDFLKSTGNMLSKGVVEAKSLNRILMNL